jgi:hypothetical protein
VTVADLIAKLLTFPQDIPVTTRMRSEDQLLLDHEPRHITPDDKWIMRNGTFIPLLERWWDYEKDGQPVFVSVCHFPGN